MGDRPEGEEGEAARDPQAAVERGHDIALACLRLHPRGADDGGDDGEAAEGERIDERRCGRGLHHQRAEQHGGDDRHRVGLEQVRGHAGAVADVVADVVGDHRRIARIVLGDAGLDLADEVGADIGALGEDAAAETREDRDQRSAEAQSHERMDDVAEIGLVDRVRLQQGEVAGNAEQAEADHQKAGDGAALEGDLQRVVQADARRLGGAHVGAHRDVHADDAAGARKDRADEEAPGRRPAEPGHQADDEEQHDADDGDGLVLAPEIRGRAFAHRGGDFAHALVALGQAQDDLDLPGTVDDRQNRADEREKESCVHVFPP